MNGACHRPELRISSLCGAFMPRQSGNDTSHFLATVATKVATLHTDSLECLNSPTVRFLLQDDGPTRCIAQHGPA